MARTSASRGTFRKVSGSAVSNDAAISFSAAFLAPLMGMAPDRRVPPRIRIRSIIPQAGPSRPKAMLVAWQTPPRQTESMEDPLCSLRRANRLRNRIFHNIFRVFWAVRRGLAPGLLLAPLQIGPQRRGQFFGGRFCHQNRTLPWADPYVIAAHPLVRAER